MKLYGIFGKGSGKVGSSVFAISGGEQIVREYNPVVSNPNTDAQQKVRARFKLLSQLAASLASVLAFEKKGLVSKRNQFISKNFSATSTEGKVAKIDLESILISNGAKPSFTLANTGDTTGVGFNLEAQSVSGSNYEGLVFITIWVDEANGLTVMNSEVKEVEAEAGESQDIVLSTSPVGQNTLFMCYGIKRGAGLVKTLLEDYGANAAQKVARLLWSASISSSSSVVTENVSAYFTTE